VIVVPCNGRYSGGAVYIVTRGNRKKRIGASKRVS
jgi:hypothetical protein